jgi:hypothetical protein
MQADLHLSSSDYSLALSIFFIGYLLLEVPSNMILSRTRPSLYLPSLMVRRYTYFQITEANSEAVCLGMSRVRSRIGCN